MRILWILLAGLIVGVLVMDSVRRIFSDDNRLVRELFESQPVTMIASATAIGSVLVWAVMESLNLW